MRNFKCWHLLKSFYPSTCKGICEILSVADHPEDKYNPICKSNNKSNTQDMISEKAFIYCTRMSNKLTNLTGGINLYSQHNCWAFYKYLQERTPKTRLQMLTMPVTLIYKLSVTPRSFRHLRVPSIRTNE